jgi:osmoprotectant transport system substrate-binding protein
MSDAPRRNPIRRGATVFGLAALGVLVAGTGLGACAKTASAPRPPSGPSITIGSTDETVQVIVANLYAGVLEHAGASVTLHTGLGTRATVEPALASGQLDLYPDVAGDLLLFVDGNDGGGGQIRGGGTAGCPTDPRCVEGLQSVYGLRFKSFTSLDDAGPITVAALEGGEVQVALVSSADGTVERAGFVALTDDRHLLDADAVVPVIRTSVDTPAVASALDALSARLSTAALSELSLAVTADHDTPAAAARQWLVHVGLI